MTLQTTITNKSSQVEELQRKLDKKDTELKKTEELRIFSHDSEVIKHQRDFAIFEIIMLIVSGDTENTGKEDI